MNAYQKASKNYQNLELQSKVNDASPHELIQMLFDAYKKNIRAAKVYMEHNKTAEKCEVITKALNIINSLKGCLDINKGGDIAQNLDTLYEYVLQRLVEANINNAPDILDECYKLIDNISSAWAQIAPATTE